MHRNSFFNLVEESFASCILMQVNDLVKSTGRTPFFIEVGANDGTSSSKTYPFIAQHEWHGLSIEPVPQAYEKLRASFVSFQNVKTLNLAVSPEVGILPFYQVVDPDNPWQTMLSSFDRSIITKQTNLIPDIERHIQKIDVASKPLSSVCSDNGVSDLDVLIIDAEGYDDKIVYTLEFDRYAPLLINFEHKHLPVDRIRAVDRFLLSKGYQRLILWADTAYLRGDLLKDESIQQCMRGLPNLIPAYDPEWGNGYWLDYWR